MIFEYIKRFVSGAIAIIVVIWALVFFVQNPATVAGGVKSVFGAVGDAGTSVKIFIEELSE